MVVEKILQTLGFFIKDGKIWLGVRIGGKSFGRGRLNGFGGDVKPGEIIEQAARREFEEESGLEIISMEKRAVIQFIFLNKPTTMREVHVFWVFGCRGEAMGGEEMAVREFFLEEINNLYDKMWPGDRLWFPMFLEGKKFRGWVFYDNPENKEVMDSDFWKVKRF